MESEQKVIDQEERSRMTEFWETHASNQGAEIKTMFLDANASNISEKDTPEVLSMLPDYKNKDILELAAGIGRFTSLLAEQGRSVVAIEFMESFSSKNEELNGHLGNIEFICDDVLNYSKEDESFDICFTCWLLMYLSDDECRYLLRQILRWLRPDGYIYIRESCFGPSGTINREVNPTHYRTPQDYLDMFRETILEENPELSYTYKLCTAKNLESYVESKGLKGQMAWLFQKVETSRSVIENQIWLDQNQYNRNMIRRYEIIYGNGFVSTGGKHTTTQLTALLDVQEGDRILDIGCGVGGGDFHLASTYKAHVHGLDLSTNMIHKAIERAIVAPKELYLTFEIADIMTVEFPERFSSFDIIYSRDTFLHIADKRTLFQRIFKWLKPGGKLLFTDYLIGSNHSEELEEYIRTYDYSLIQLSDYEQLLIDAGFEDITCEDRTQQFLECLNYEREKIESHDFLDEEDYQHLVEGWQKKIERSQSNQQKWGVCMARKPNVENNEL